MGRATSDEQYIEQIRKREERRRAASYLAIALGLALLGAAWLATNAMFRSVLLADILPAPGSSPDIILTIEKTSYWWGVAVGFCTALAWLLAAYFIFSGIYNARQGRTERLLLEYVDRESTSAESSTPAAS
ncbi:MAG: hypothetical protein GF331_09555 [Chitinivibrionales bacterium]|nr:hypothetical protein [Chitinivibrionales bacterium]